MLALEWEQALEPKGVPARRHRRSPLIPLSQRASGCLAQGVDVEAGQLVPAVALLLALIMDARPDAAVE